MVTRPELEEAFARAGVRGGDVVLVHASLSRLGFVVGGAVAVVQALIDAVGAAGTVVVPTFTAGNSDPERWARTRGSAVPHEWWPAIRECLPAFDPRVSPSERMGAVAEAVRTWPGAVRSTHPQTSFAAVGAEAGALMDSHPVECHLGPGTPLERLFQRKAKVLLVGVSYGVCTAFHLGEYRQADPPLHDYGCVVLENGRRRWFWYRDVLLDDSDFEQLGSAMEESIGATRIRRVGVGSTQVRLIPMEDCVGFAQNWLASHRQRTKRS